MPDNIFGSVPQFTNILLVFYCLVAGLFLVLAPWSDDWRLAAGIWLSEPLAAAACDNYVRGFVSGLGLAHVGWGIFEFNEMLLTALPASDRGSEAGNRAQTRP